MKGTVITLAIMIVLYIIAMSPIGELTIPQILEKIMN